VKHLDLADALRARLVARELGPRGALPGELDLAREFGTSRVTVRRALDLLRQEGLVTSRRGAGWFAAIDPLRQPLGRVKTVEAAVEAAGARPGRRVVAFGFVAAPPAAVEALRLAPTDTEVLRVVRVNMADDEPFALVTVWVRADIGADVSRADVERTTFYDLLPIRGVELESVHQTITAEVAGDATAELLACSPGDPLLLVRRVTCDVRGDPALYSEHRYPAERTTFEIEFSIGTGTRQHV